MSEQTNAQARFAKAHDAFEEMPPVDDLLTQRHLSQTFVMADAAMERAEELAAAEAGTTKTPLEIEMCVDSLLLAAESYARLGEVLANRMEDLERWVNQPTELVSNHTESTIRVRISHAHTLKDGWRCDSTTVEWIGSVPVDREQIKEEMLAAWSLGWNEANVRNAELAGGATS